MSLNLWLRGCFQNIQDFQHVSKCPNHWFMLPLHWQQVSANSSALYSHYAVLCQSFQSAITVLRREFAEYIHASAL